MIEPSQYVFENHKQISAVEWMVLVLNSDYGVLNKIFKLDFFFNLNLSLVNILRLKPQTSLFWNFMDIWLQGRNEVRWPRVWCHHVRIWGLSEANVLKKLFVALLTLKKVYVTLLTLKKLFVTLLTNSYIVVWTFRLPPQWFGVQGIVPPCPPSSRPSLAVRC